MEDQNLNEIDLSDRSSDENKSDPSLSYLSDHQKGLFIDIGKWASISGILLYTITALGIFGIYRAYDMLGNFGGIWIIVIGGISILLYFFMALSAQKFGANLKRSSVSDDPDHFYKASNHLLAFFQILGIPLMILTVLYGVIIVFALLFGGLGALMG